MASRYSRKDGAQENNMIIDFEQYTREHAPEAMQSAQELEALEGLTAPSVTSWAPFLPMV